jgi:hypothetical protein
MAVRNRDEGPLDPGHQVFVTGKLVLPVAVDADAATRGAAAPKVQPPDILRVGVERNASGDLKNIMPTRAATLLQFSLIQKF